MWVWREGEESFIKDIFSCVKGRTEVGRRAEVATLVKMTYGDLCCPAQPSPAQTAQPSQPSPDTKCENCTKLRLRQTRVSGHQTSAAVDNNGGGRIYQSIALRRAE